MKKGVKVNVDFARGSYTIVGYDSNGKVSAISSYVNNNVNIPGGSNGKIIATGSSKLSRDGLEERRDKMLEDLRELGIKYDKNFAKNVDILLLGLLREFDRRNGTKYSKEYLLTVFKEYDRNEGEDKFEFEERCRKDRKKHLEDVGLEITYRIGVLGTTDYLSLSEKNKIIKMAKRSKNWIGAEVINYLRVSEDYTNEDIDLFLNRTKIEDLESDIQRLSDKASRQAEEIDKEQESSVVDVEQSPEQAEELYIDIKPASEKEGEGVEELYIDVEPASKKTQKKVESSSNIVKNNNFVDDIAKIVDEELGSDVSDEDGKYTDFKNEFLKQIKLIDEQQRELERKIEELNKQREELQKSFIEQIRMIKQKDAIKPEEVAPKKEEKIEEVVLEKEEEEPEEVVPEKEEEKIEEVVFEKEEEEPEEVPEKEEEKPEEDASEKDEDEEEKEEEVPEKEEKEHLKRKVSDPEDSIYNKHYRHTPDDPTTLRIIRGIFKGAITLLAIGGVVLTINNNKMDRTKLAHKEQPKVETTLDTENTDVTTQAQEQDKIQTTITYTTKEGETQTMTTYTTAKIQSQTTATTTKSTEPQTVTTSTSPKNQNQAVIGTNTTASSKTTTTATTTKPAQTTTSTTTTKPAQTTTTTTKPNQSQTTTKPSEDNKPSTSTNTNKTDAQKIEEFKNTATQTYMKAFIIGEKPNVGDIFKDKTYSQNPDGSGRKGYFNYYEDYSISHINIITNEGWHTVRVDGKNLVDILAEYPDCIDYNVHFINSKTGGGLGFVTKSQLDDIINNKVKSIIESKNLNINNIIEDENVR